MFIGPLLSDGDGVHDLPGILFNAVTFSSRLPRASLPQHHQHRTEPQVPPHIAAYIHEVVKNALKDPVGHRDFALMADGARIALPLTSSLQSTGSSIERPPSNILDEDLRSGSCWAFPGNRAQIAIKTSTLIYPSHITIDHVSRDIAADIRQAPRNIVVWGLLEGKANQKHHADIMERLSASSLNTTGDGPPIKNGGIFLPLAAFEYVIDSDSIQTFAFDPVITSSGMYFGVYVVEIRSNWGASSTRLYRVRIHGSAISSGLDRKCARSFK